MPEFMTVLEVASLLKVSDRTVYQLCRRGLADGDGPERMAREVFGGG